MKQKAEELDSNNKDGEQSNGASTVGFGFVIERGDDVEEESKRGDKSQAGSARNTQQTKDGKNGTKKAAVSDDEMEEERYVSDGEGSDGSILDEIDK